MARYAFGDVVNGLVKRGVPLHVAQGVAMNFKDESGLDTGIQEGARNVHGTRGYGIAQWTDTAPGNGRRTNLERFAQSQGRPVDDLDTQLDFFAQENAGPEAGAWAKVMAAPNAQEAAINFVKHWERPAAQHVSSRAYKYAGTDPNALMSAHSDERERDTSLSVQQANTPAPFKPQDTPATSSTEEEPKGFDMANFMANAGKAFGGAGGGVPSVPLAPPVTTWTQSQPMQLLDPASVQASRAKLAEAMARLNSGQLVVG